MAKTTKISAPSTWFGTHLSWLAPVSVVAMGAFFRFWQLPSLPPGLSGAEAKIGLEAVNLAQHGVMPGLTAINSYALLWVWLEALSVKLLGPTPLALRLWAALLGVAAVYATWIWARDWFGPRIAWLAGLIMAVTPWSVTLSRNGLSAALILLLVPLTLWIATAVYRHRNLRHQLALVVVLILDLLAGPLGILLAMCVVIIGAIQLGRRGQLWHIDRDRLIVLGGVAVGLAVLSYLVVVSQSELKLLPQATGLSAGIGAMGDAFLRTLLMFNLHGDENVHHNFGAEPMLNAFVGLMFVAGVLVTISRLQQRRYQLLLGLWLVLLVPAWVAVANTPNGARAAAALPLVAALASIGISYMLELWYATFPINSAARASGQLVILALLVLTLFQGYAQYFRAWAGSSDTYAAYEEPATAASSYLLSQKGAAQRYIIGTATEQPIMQYLLAGTNYQALEPARVAALTIGAGPRQFIITGAARDETAKNLSLKFPGGTLKPHNSAFSGNEIYYTYEVAK